MNQSWVGKVVRKQEDQFKRLKASEQAAYFAPRKGFSFRGMDISCIPDSECPWDPAVVKAIQVIAPDIVPIWVRYIYTEAESKTRLVIGRHGLGRVEDSPHAEKLPFPCHMPQMPSQGIQFSRPNIIEWIFNGERDPRAADLPGAYIPFDWNVFKFVESCYRHHDIKALKKKFVEDAEEAYWAEQEQRKKDEEYRLAPLRKYTQKKLEQISDVELSDYFLNAAEESKYEAKPTVDLGKKP